MRKQVVPYLNGEALYSITRAGVQALERWASITSARILNGKGRPRVSDPAFS